MEVLNYPYWRQSKPNDLKNRACYVSPTSNFVERLFSMATIVYSPSCRHVMLPVHLEEDLYLLLNKELWNERTVAKIMAQNK